MDTVGSLPQPLSRRRVLMTGSTNTRPFNIAPVDSEQAKLIRVLGLKMRAARLLVCSLVAGLTSAGSSCMSFLSRPDLLVPRLEIRSSNPARQNPGHWFLSTWGGDCQYAPYIYDSNGNLVWSGYRPELADTGYFNFKRHILADGSNVLSVFRGKSEKGRGQGHVVLLGESYQVLRTIEPRQPGRALDFHEFDLIDEGRKAIVVRLDSVQGDLSHFNISGSLGWILDSVFQEVDLESGEVLFEWHSAEHIPISESSISPNVEAGAGLSYFYAFDHFHINSVAKFPDGDYLVSARHTDTLYKISRRDGSIVWRLGGPNSTFALSANLAFSAQHDARIIDAATPTNLTLSLFNNAWNGETQTANTSSAMLIALDLPFLTATLTHQYFPPSHGVGGMLARHQGNVQRLPRSGNVVVSWGALAAFSEFDGATGEPVLDVAFTDTETHNYRVEKHAGWVGRPAEPPAAYLYARNSSAATHFYVSWNGATEVAGWRLFAVEARGGGGGGVGQLLGEVERTAFEMHFAAERHVAAGFVQAVDARGAVLGRSGVVRTVVPPESLADACGEAHCTVQQGGGSVKGAGVAADDEGRLIETGALLQVQSAIVQGIAFLVVGFFAGKFSRR